MLSIEEERHFEFLAVSRGQLLGVISEISEDEDLKEVRKLILGYRSK